MNTNSPILNLSITILLTGVGLALVCPSWRRHMPSTSYRSAGTISCR